MPAQMQAPNKRITIEPLTQKAFAQFGTVIQNPTRSPSSWSQKPDSVSANQGSATKYLDVSLMNNHYDVAPSRVPAKAVMNMFVCKPRKLQPLDSSSPTHSTKKPAPVDSQHPEFGGAVPVSDTSVSELETKVFPVSILERHPYTPQTFIPVGLSPSDKSTTFLVVVAPTLSSPSLPVSASLESVPDGLRPKGTGLPDLSGVKAFVADGSQAVTYGPGTWHAPMVVLGAESVDFVVVQFANGVGDEDCQEVELRRGERDEGICVIVEEGMGHRVSNLRARL